MLAAVVEFGRLGAGVPSHDLGLFLCTSVRTEKGDAGGLNE